MRSLNCFEVSVHVARILSPSGVSVNRGQDSLYKERGLHLQWGETANKQRSTSLGMAMAVAAPSRAQSSTSNLDVACLLM
jgi:hypothetical protein